MRVAMSFYTTGREQTVWTEMPQVPAAGDTVHYSPDHTAEEDRAWRVMHVSWACDDFTRDVWHAEIGLD
jgi:hypothetical protein